MMSQTRALLGAYVVGDTDGVLPRCTPACTFSIPGDPRVLPWAGRYVGGDFRRFHAAIKDHVDVQDYVAPWLELWGDRCMLLMRERARLRGSGGRFSQHLLGVFRYEGGQLCSYDEDSDPWAMEEAVRGGEAAPPDEPPPPWIAAAGGWGGVRTRSSAAVRADGDTEQTAALLRAVAQAEVEEQRSALRSAAHLGLTVWVGGADPHLPWAGTASGPAALASVSGARGAAWRRELVGLQVEAYGGSALLRLRERVRSAAGGPTVEVERAVLGAARNGLLTRWWEWADTAALARVSGAGA
jgi:hypothetical protein